MTPRHGLELMIKHILTTLTSLSLLAGGNLAAQTSAISPVDAWKALRASASFNYATADARAVVDAIVAQPKINTQEARIVESYYANTQGRSAWIEVARGIIGKSSYALAQVKLTDKDFSGWTSDIMVDGGAGFAITLITDPKAPESFRNLTWAYIRSLFANWPFNSGAPIKHRGDFVGIELVVQTAFAPDTPKDIKTAAWNAVTSMSVSSYESFKRFFKMYRMTLPKAEQFAATQKQKDILLAKDNRDAAENAWLAEVSADLIALQLDQR